MKKNLLSFFIVLACTATTFAQCDPFSVDWGDAPFGVSPNPNAGENFLPAIINQPYFDEVHVKCPSSIQDVDPTIIINASIDSISLDSITIFNGIADVSLTNIGLNVSCNNNGDSPNPCMFYPGNFYCGDLYGTPTVAGEFPAKIYITAYFNLFGPTSLAYPFDGYVISVTDPAGVSIREVAKTEMNLGQNKPNPAVMSTEINYELPAASTVHFEVLNLVGQTVMSKDLAGKRGTNTIRLDTGDMESGVYLYSIRSGDKKLTKRLVVQH